MAANTVTRPAPATADADPGAPMGLPAADVAHYAKWVIIGALVLAGIGLAAVIVITVGENQRVSHLRQQWDLVFEATKDKKKPNELIPALEGVAEKVKGSPAHAYVLMKLADEFFAQGVKEEKPRETKAAALAKAISLYKLVATTEPYNKNPLFGPLAIQNAALALEQNEDYDGAIQFLTGAIAAPEIESHFLYNRMLAQLGRLYWLRSLKKPADSKEALADREEARKRITDALRASGSDNDGYKWREEAEYIKSLVDKPGKALPDGKAPPVKEKPPEKTEAPAAPPAKPEPPQTTRFADPAGNAPAAAPAQNAAPANPAAPAAPAAPAQPKNDAPDPQKKADDKKQGSAAPVQENGRAVSQADASASPSGHISAAQIQQMLKEGRPAFCQCPRCTAGNEKPASARMVE